MWFRLKSFLRFYKEACTVYNIQSAFLYDFVNNVLDTSREYYVFKSLETLRKIMRKSGEMIPSEDYGAGSAYGTINQTIPLDKIVRTAVSNPHKCRKLFNLVNFTQAKKILELGTSAGLSSAYLAAADSNAEVLTLEGNRNLADVASRYHAKAGLNNIRVLPGRFEKNLNLALQSLGSVDIAYLDGNHRYDSTVQYFQEILRYCHPNSVMVVDDIYWSAEMTKAWQWIKNAPEVSLTVDVFNMGFVFLNPALSKENICLIPYIYKPWKIGLFGK
jgi:predicted O-methyltransferase YrrM